MSNIENVLADNNKDKNLKSTSQVIIPEMVEKSNNQVQTYSEYYEEKNTFELHVDSVGYVEKPDGIQNQIRRRTQSKPAQRFTVNKLIEDLTHGHTVSLGVMKGGLKSKNWYCQQVFFIDIDNDNINYPQMSVDDALEICKKKYNINPTFIYFTYSHSAYKAKFRICFILDKPIYTEYQRFLIMQTLNSIFVQSDKACKDATRLHYGTNKKEFPYRDDNARLTFDEILMLSEKLDLPAVKNNFENNIAQNDNELINLVKDYDFETYLRLYCGDVAYETDNYIVFVKCPICSHQKCFVYYKNNKMFKCFGANGGQAGNILNFISITEHLTMKQAVEKFKFDILGYDKPTKSEEVTEFISIKKPEVAYLYKILKSLKKKPYKYERSDLGISSLFAITIKDLLRFNPDRNCWMFYDGKKWINDVGNCYVNRYGKYFKEGLYYYSLDDDIFIELDEATRDEENDKYKKYINSYGSKRRRDVMIKDAECLYPICNKDLDANPHLLNLQNGTLNLITLELQEHKSSDLISKIANVSYNPNAKAERFKKFLNEIMLDNQSKIAFILRFLGYCLTADTKEEKIIIFYGSTTRNGKSTLLETFLNILGDYGVSINPETLAVKRFSDSRSANGDIARLDGVRFVNAPEPPENMLLNVSDIKTLTGGDTITARNPYERHFQFKPQFKLVINTNHLPKVNDNTLFMSNRVYVVTFDKHFEEIEQDKTLKHKLSQPEEMSGILNLLIDSLRDYRKNGLNPPPEVINATLEYEGECDMVKNFIDECMEDADGFTLRKRAYITYEAWCSSNNTPVMPYQTFNRKLENIVNIGRRGDYKNVIMGKQITKEWIKRI